MSNQKITMKKISISGLMLLSLFNIYAQDSLKISVIDADDKKPLSGASILVSGNVIAVTNNKGTYTVPCSGESEITITYVGYTPITRKVKDCKGEINIALTSSTNNLNEVEVTSTANPNKALIYQSVSITKLTPVELKRSWGLYLDDAINTNTPGVFMEKRAVSSGQQFNIRGYGNGIGFRGASSNFDGQGTKVYLNGIPLTDAEGITVLDDIDFASVGNVEVIKGPAGSLYGLAIAGVVNLETIKPKKGETSIGQDLMFGSYGLQRYTTHFAMGTDKASLLVNYGHQKSDGYMVHNASHKDFVNVAGEFRPNNKQAITAYFGYSNSYDQRGGELTIGQYDTLDYSGNPEYIKRDAHSALTSFRGGLGHTYIFNKYISNTTTVFATGVFNNSSSAAGWTDKNSINFGLRSTINANYDFGKGFGISAIVGTELQQQLAQTTGYNMVPDTTNAEGYYKIGAIKSNAFAKEGTWSFISELTLKMPYDFALTFGAGVSSMNININDRFYVATSTNPTKYGTSYNNLFSPKVTLNKVFKKQYSVYLAYSRGYKAPVSSNIFISATGAINTGLKPEKADQFEIGTKGSALRNRINYNVAAYYTMFTDKMAFIAVPLDSANAIAYTYTSNAGGQNNIGVEASIRAVAYEAPKGYITISPFANFCYSYSRYNNYHLEALNSAKTEKVITDYSGNAVAGVSPITANAGVDFTTKYGIYANLTYSYRSSMPITSDGLNKTKDYNLLNTKIGFQRTFFKHLNVNAYFGVNNITGTQYYYMVFLNQLPDAYLPAPRKANFYGGLGLSAIF